MPKTRRLLKKKSKHNRKKKYTRKGGGIFTTDKTITIKYAHKVVNGADDEDDTKKKNVNVQLKKSLNISDLQTTDYNVFEIKYNANDSKETNIKKYTKPTNRILGIITNYPEYIPLYKQNFSTKTGITIPITSSYITSNLLNCYNDYDVDETATLVETSLDNNKTLRVGKICDKVMDIIKYQDVCEVGFDIPTKC